MAEKKRRTPRPTAVRTPREMSLTDELIAERAYNRWIARGCPLGDGRDDWFAAQAELLAENSTKPARSARASKMQSATV
ncbi:MAG: DUF2934 domain-containing protein [Polyangiales bacterium]